jgi:hypothetical protein
VVQHGTESTPTAAGSLGDTGHRSSNSGANHHRERPHATCTPAHYTHATLTTGFIRFQGQWRTHAADTNIGTK